MTGKSFSLRREEEGVSPLPAETIGERVSAFPPTFFSVKFRRGKQGGGGLIKEQGDRDDEGEISSVPPGSSLRCHRARLT